MRDVYVIGVGMNRFGKYPEASIGGMAKVALDRALEDAGVSGSQLEAAYFSNTFWGMYSDQHSIRGQVALRPLGIGDIPIINTENACAGASTAFYLGCQAVASGMNDLVLALGAEKMTHENKSFSLRAYTACTDVGNAASQLARMMELNGLYAAADPEGRQTPSQARSVFMDIYSLSSRMHMSRYGTTQRQLAVISSKNHFNGSLNPLAQIQRDMTVEEVLADPLISFPLTRAMCSPVGDGAAAAILCSRSFLKRLGGARPVKVRCCVLGSGKDRELEEEDIGSRLSKRAYNLAGVGPEDIGVAELHDATAFGELLQTEALGFCAPGEGGSFAESGATRLGGKIPINTSGGLESRGHPVGASGLAMIHEIVTQLRSEAGRRQADGVRLGLVENGGGNIGYEEAAMTISILEKVRQY